MSTKAKIAVSYVAVALISIVLAIEWKEFSKLLRGMPGSVHLLLVALIARFLGFGPALLFTLASSAVLWLHVLPLVFPAATPAFYIVRLAIFVICSIVIASISRQRSKEAREAEERYRALVELSPDGVLLTDESGTILFANSALAQTVGAADATTLIGRNAIDLSPPEEREAAQHRLNQVIAGQPAPWRVASALRLDGSVARVERSGVPYRRKGKRLAQGFIRDLTERTDRESKLEESRRRLEALFNSAIDAIFFFDSAGRVVDANPAATTLLGHGREELLRASLHDIAPMAGASLAAGGSAAGEGTVIRNDGTAREVEYRGVGNVMPGVHFVMLRDITDRKDAERSVRQLSGRLLGLQDEERRRIARQLHDTTAQNLAALRLNLSSLSRAATSDTGSKPLLEESIALTDESISEVRTLSYLLHPPLIDEAGLVATLRWFLRGFETRSGIKVSLDVPDDFQRLSPETETTLFRIIQEALTNIQRHSGSPAARIRLHTKDQRVILNVVDEGIGVPAHLRGNEEALVASGLGIAGIRQRARELGGQMQIESSNSGTEVTVVLPLVAKV
jgi:PAS domain S-box-containing protein